MCVLATAVDPIGPVPFHHSRPLPHPPFPPRHLPPQHALLHISTPTHRIIIITPLPGVTQSQLFPACRHLTCHTTIYSHQYPATRRPPLHPPPRRLRLRRRRHRRQLAPLLLRHLHLQRLRHVQLRLQQAEQGLHLHRRG